MSELLHGARVVAFFPGTKIPVPMTVLAGTAEAGTTIYSETWTCTGDYGCTGNKAHKRTTRTHRCCAQLVTVRATAAAPEACMFTFTEDGDHGDEFSLPAEVPERYAWRSKVAVERAARAGVKMDEMIANYWPADTP
jgi:hypothetical protein